MENAAEEKKCPVCGQGDLLDITFRDGSEGAGAGGEDIQLADTRQVESYSCGHEVQGPALSRSAAGSDDLEVERRESEETVDPVEPS